MYKRDMNMYIVHYKNKDYQFNDYLEAFMFHRNNTGSLPPKATNERSERIKEKISIFSVLHSYNYDVVDSPREQQFRCNLHGDGSDNSPSARAYPDSNSWYCFACGKTRDAISTVMEIEGVSFNQACKALETKYDLPVWVYSRESSEDHFKDEPAVDDLSILVSRTEKLLMFKTKDIEARHFSPIVGSLQYAVRD